MQPFTQILVRSVVVHRALVCMIVVASSCCLRSPREEKHRVLTHSEDLVLRTTKK